MRINKKKHAILIVEDETDLLAILTKKFTAEGFIVTGAPNGQLGLERALATKPDIIVLDSMMPVLDGFSMLRKLRCASTWGKTVPVILFTNISADQAATVAAIAETQPAYYLIKADWKLGSLVKKVRELLEK